MKPWIHAELSAKRRGGVPEDYVAIHSTFDSSKGVLADNRHRVLFHTAFGIFLVERIYGVTITNSDGKVVSVRDIGEQDHCLPDFGKAAFIPTAADALVGAELPAWVQVHGNDLAIEHARRSAAANGGTPQEYLPIHELLNASQGYAPGTGYLMLTHHDFFIKEVAEVIFGPELVLSSGERIPVKTVCAEHIAHDLGRDVPGAQEYLEHLAYHSWWNNGAGPDIPQSCRRIAEARRAGAPATRRLIYRFD